MTGLVAIDHGEARRLAAGRLDGAIEAADAMALDDHLATCPECRRVVDAMGADALALRDLDLGPVPVAVRADVSIAAERGGRGGHLGRWVGLVAVGAVLVALLGGGALGGAGGPGPSDSPVRVHWTTDVVDLTAQDITVTAGGRIFSPLGPKTQVHSDPGDATYRTLEIEWDEGGVGQRIYVYLTNDDRTWWSNEIRIYNGAAQGEWLYAKGRFFETPMGQAWRGDAEIPFTDPDHRGGLPANLRLTGATIGIAPADLVAAPAGGGIRLPEDTEPFASGGPLHCSGILQMTPRQAEAALLSLGYLVSWRLTHLDQAGVDGTASGYSQPLEHAPDSVFIGAMPPTVGTEGQIILFVAKPGDRLAVPPPFPADCPKADPNAAPPIAEPATDPPVQALP